MFTRIGRDISTAVSLPLIAGAFGAFHALLAESARSFGPLFQAFESLKAEFHDLFLAIAHELEPTFRQIIGLLRGGVATLRGWIDAFHQLPESVRKAVIFTLAFLAALGPTLFVVGKLITAIGALGRILPLLVSPMGLAVIAVAALAAAAIYVVTHWDWAKLRLALAWAFIKELFFDGVRVSILSLDILTLGILKLTGVTDFLREKLNELADRSLAKSAAQILEFEANLRKAHGPMEQLGTTSLKIRKIMQVLSEGLRRTGAEAAVIGITFNQQAAAAQHFQQSIQQLIAAGVNPWGEQIQELAQKFLQATEDARAFNEAVGAFGPRLEQQIQAAKRFQELLGAGLTPTMAGAAVVAEAEIIQSVMGGLVDSLTAIGTRIGEIFGGVRQGFRGFAAQMAALLGGVIAQIGKTLVQMGIAAIAAGKLGVAIKFFAKNPFAAIAAGIALVTLGNALAASSQRALEEGFSGGGGGGGGSVEASTPSAAASGEDGGTLILRIPDIYRRLNPEFVDIIAQALQEAQSRNVIVEVTE